VFVLICLLSGLLIGVQGISYKLVSTFKYDSDRFRLILIWTGAVLAAIGVAANHEDLANRIVLLGSAAAGVFGFIALLTIMQAMASGPVSFTWVLANLSIGVPILLSALIWAEPIRHVQWAGIGLFVLSLMLFGRDLQRNGSTAVTLKWIVISAIMFLANGSFLLCFRAVNRYTSVPHTFSALLTTYMVCGSLLLVYSWRRLAWPRIGEINLSLLGAAGMMGGQALIIKALAINTASSLPIIHSTSIISVTLASVIFFKERLSKYSGSGLLFSIVSIILLTMG
jgi:drug/metabolite transporter (DMT)-like permease